MVRQIALQIRRWQICLGWKLECPSGMVLIFLYYDHVHIIVQPETSSYSLSYFARIGHLDPKYLCSPILAFHLNCTKGT